MWKIIKEWKVKLFRVELSQKSKIKNWNKQKKIHYFKFAKFLK